MTLKSLLVGAGLVIVGLLLGFGMGMKSAQCPIVKKKCCPAEMRDSRQGNFDGYRGCNPQNGHKFGPEGRAGFERGFGKFEIMKDELAADLNLSEEQVKQLDELFAAKQKEMQAARKEHRKQMREEMQKTHDQIKALLNEDQKVKFDEIIIDYFPRCNKK